MLKKSRELLADNHIQSGNHKRLRTAAFRLVLGSLERFVRVEGKTIEIEAVIPVRTSYKRQPMRTQMRPGIVKTYPQMLQKGLLASRHIVKRHHFIKNRKVTGLPDISERAEQKPKRVIIESRADSVIAALGERLILMVAAPVRKLCRRNVKNPCPRPLRNLMHKAYQVLVRITETHSASYSALEEACAAAHIECNHALVLVPDIQHPVQLRHGRTYRKFAEHTVPILPKLIKSPVSLLCRRELLKHCICQLLVYYTGA